MKKVLFLILISVVILAVGCCPCRHLMTSTQDSVRVETIIRTEHIPDTVFIEIPVESERQTVRDTTSHLETSFAVSDARITSDGALFHSLENKTQKKPILTEKEIIYRDSIVYKDKIVEKVVPVERELTKWQKFQIKGFWIILSLFLIIFFRKNIISIIKRIL